MRIRLERALCVVGIAAIHGCGSEGASPDDVVRRDSMGVTIVENAAALADMELSWTVDSVPDVDIGATQGEEAYQLFRVTGVAELADGRIVVVNAGTQELRFFDAQGTHIASVGGEGDGPGEFRFPMLVRTLRHDTLWIYDRASRVSHVDAQGSFLRTLAPPIRLGEPIGVLAGRLIAGYGSARAGPESSEGIIPNDMAYASVDLMTAASDTLLEIEGIDLFLANDGRRVSFTPIPFDAPPTVAVANDLLFVTPGEIAEVRVLDGTGVLQQIFRILRAPEPVPQAAFDRLVEDRVAQAQAPNAAAELRRHYAEMPVPDVMPVFQNLLVDASGHLWLEAFRWNDEASPSWVVMDPSGRVLGRIATPRGVTIWQIGTDFILGVRRDESDVEHVVRYRLRRSP